MNKHFLNTVGGTTQAERIQAFSKSFGLVNAQDARDRMWARHSEVIDYEYCLNACNPDRDKINEYKMAAVLLDEYARRIYDIDNEPELTPLECTCPDINMSGLHGNTMVCAYCEAQELERDAEMYF